MAKTKVQNVVKKTGDDGKSEENLSREIDSRWKKCERYYRNAFKLAKEDYRFGRGDQWTQEEKDKLARQGRPCMVFNRIKAILTLVSGYQRENSARIKVNPEGGEDKIFSEVVDKGIHFTDKISHLTFKLGYQFDDGLYCGRGYVEAIRTFEKDPIRGEIRFKQLTPYQVFVDPDCREYDPNEGAKYVFKIVRLSKSELMDIYPEKAKTIKGFTIDNDSAIDNALGVESELDDTDDYGKKPGVASQGVEDEGEEDDPADHKFTVKEYWHKKNVTRYFVINVESGEPEKFKTKEEAEAFIETQGFGKVIERKVPEMHVAAKVCGYVVQDMVSDFEPYYSGFTIFRFLADWSPNAEDEESRTFGLVRPLKDPQREKNKAKSQNLHILNTQANSGWIGDQGALDQQGWTDLEAMGSRPGIVIKKIKPGAELREILPKGPNSGQLAREQKAEEEFTQISGINPDLLGFQEGTQSGRAIALRMKQAVMALVNYFYNYRYTKECIGMFILQTMPMVFDTKKLMRILGRKYMESVKTQEYPDGLGEGHIQAFLQMIKDSKYDLVVSEADANPTVRYETLQTLLEILKAAPVPPDLLIDFMDIPNSEEVKNRIQAYQQQQAAAAAAAKGAPGA